MEKVLPAVINIILGRGWPQLVLSRWTNCGSALRRGLLCCLGPRLLPRALTALRQKCAGHLLGHPQIPGATQHLCTFGAWAGGIGA